MLENIIFFLYAMGMSIAYIAIYLDTAFRISPFKAAVACLIWPLLPIILLLIVLYEKVTGKHVG